MTSNIGSQLLLDGMANGVIPEGVKDGILAQLRQEFRPEFLNRVDDIVVFKPLQLDEIEQIVGLLMVQLQSRLAERKISLELTEPACKFIAKNGFDPVYGARPLKRYIQRQLETRIGRKIIGGEIPDGSTLTIDADKTDLTITIE